MEVDVNARGFAGVEHVLSQAVPHVGRREFRSSLKQTLDLVHEVGAVEVYNGSHKEAVLVDIEVWEQFARQSQAINERQAALRLMVTALKAGIAFPSDLAEWVDADVDHEALKRFRSAYPVNAERDEYGRYGVVDQLPATDVVDDLDDEVEFLNA